MTQPTPYTRQYNFTNYQSSNPTTPLPGNQVDAELNAVKTATDAIGTNIALIQRDDGKLANGSVHQDAFSTAALLLISGWNPRGPWANATAYAVKDMVTSGGTAYVCYTAHTSSGAIDTGKFSAIGAGTGDVLTTAANTFTAIAQSIINAALGDYLIAQSTNAGAAVGPDIVLDRNSASPAASDLLGRLIYRARSSTAVSRNVAAAFAKLLTATNAAEDAELHLQTIAAGALSDALVIGKNGVYTPSATGGDKGTDTINATTLYEAGTSLAAKYPRLATASLYTAQQYFSFVTITDAATIAWDCAAAQNAKLTLGAAGRTMGLPTNIVDGASYILRITQDGTGNRTITTWNAAFDFGAAGSPTLTTTASKTDYLQFIGRGTTKLDFIGITKAYT